MDRAARLSAVTAALLVAAAACATTGDLRNAEGTGTTRFYGAPFEAVWQAALEAIDTYGLQLDRADDFDRFIAATHVPDRTGTGREDEIAVSADQGERIGIFVDSVAPGVWGVEIVTRRRFALDPQRLSWAQDLFSVIERRLGQARVEPPPGAVDTVPADTATDGAAPSGGADGR